MTPAALDLRGLLVALDDPAFLADAAPRTTATPGPRAPEEPAASTAARDLAAGGYVRIEHALDPGDATALVTSIEALRAKGLPPLFVYAFDETWRIGERFATFFTRALGAEYVLLPDAWAFWIAPAPDRAGWPPHRGSYDLASDRGAPDLLNVWVALTDATIDNSCMHVVPLEDDAAYPSDLRSHDASATKGRALPIPSATALAWNANVLHWGGPSSASARAPRVSITFTLARRGAQGDAGLGPVVGIAHDARLDVLARQILVYATSEHDFPDLVRQWAQARVGLSMVAKQRRDPSGRKAP